jgi:hypothetical protein
MGKVEKTAVERTLASAGGLLALTQAVKSMDEIVPSSRYEAEFVRALVDVALADASHVILKTTAVEALERVTRVATESGVYDLKSVRLAHDTLQTMSYLDESGYYSGAALAYERLAKDSTVFAALHRPSRTISSQGVPVPDR